jgi:hypothetical protein
MRTKLKNYLPALACAPLPILCDLLIRPHAEIGDDDWSYIKTAQVLAQTGHIAYNGWATAMLGWQLCFGAFFVKLFGFSFTAVRFSTAIEAVATAFLPQRTCLRAGLNSWNAALATMDFRAFAALPVMGFCFYGRHFGRVVHRGLSLYVSAGYPGEKRKFRHGLDQPGGAGERGGGNGAASRAARSAGDGSFYTRAAQEEPTRVLGWEHCMDHWSGLHGGRDALVCQAAI